MTPSHSNIVAFPSPTTKGLPVLPQSASSAVVLPALDTLSADERADYVASIVRSAIGFARRKSRRLECLPPQLRAWLLALCDLGDPTCLMVRDWLTGNTAIMNALASEDV
jgi:hypothetical protein